MKIAAALVFAAAIGAATAWNDIETTRMLRTKIIDHVNSVNTTWRAGENPSTAGRTYAQIARMCGTRREGGPTLPRQEVALADVALPDSFDARTQWSQCASVAEIRDQADCGSCYVFATVEAATDRMCIATNAQNTDRLSTEDPLSCCSSCGDGCNGGYPSAVFEYLSSTGGVTGGAYGDYSWCQSYELKPCAHHTTKGPYAPCPSGIASTPSCEKKCDSQSTYKKSFDEDKHVFASAYSVSSSETAIRQDIMENGPVAAAMDVYADFESYTGGVYKHTTGSYLGGHAIRIIGWGVDNGTPYWTVANSWNKYWGENGTFRIVRGSDECGIESQISAIKYK